MSHDPLCAHVRAVMAEDQNPPECLWCAKIADVRADERAAMSGRAVWAVETDETCGMTYIVTEPERVVGTAKMTVHRDAYIDLDASGKIVGIEIFDWPMKQAKPQQHRFVMDTEFEMCVRCGALLDSISQDGIHWFQKEGDNG